MSRTFEEKVRYNEKKSKEGRNMGERAFPSGYDFGVTLYKSYIKAPKEAREQIKSIFDNARKNLSISRASLKKADNDMSKYNAKYCVDYNNGILCGMRDAANERKKRQAPPS